EATVLKDEIVRLMDIPLVIKMPGMPQVARGAQVGLDLLRWDEVDLSVEARLLDVMQHADAGSEQTLDALDDEDMSDDLQEGDAEPVPDAEAGTEAVAESDKNPAPAEKPTSE